MSVLVPQCPPHDPHLHPSAGQHPVLDPAKEACSRQLPDLPQDFWKYVIALALPGQGRVPAFLLSGSNWFYKPDGGLDGEKPDNPLW